MREIKVIDGKCRQRHTKPKRETVQVRVTKPCHFILKEEAEELEMTISKLLEAILRGYFGKKRLKRSRKQLTK